MCFPVHRSTSALLNRFCQQINTHDSWGIALLGSGDIAYTVTKGSEGDGCMFAINRVVCEGDFQDGNIVNHWRRDGGDEKQDASDKQEQSSKMMEDSGVCHGDWLYEGLLVCGG
jgi:hypothetical protein